MTRFGTFDDVQRKAYKEMVRLAFTETPENNEWSFQESKPDEMRGLIDDAGMALVGMRIIDGGALYFRDEIPLKTALITSVASSPENRRKGYIRAMFAGMFAEQRAVGTTLTALYPFSFPFYRAFGYELASDIANHTVHLDQFTPYRKAAEIGTFVAATEKDWETLSLIYKTEARKNLGFIARNQLWWKFTLSHERTPTPAYIYYNAAGQPAGYVIYHFKDKENGERDMIVSDLRAIDRPAFEALLGFLYNHDAQAEKMQMWLPSDYPLATQIPDPRKDKTELWKGYMLRFLDIAGALRGRTWVPEAQGEFTMTVTDAMIAENTGTYHVRVRDGRAEVEQSAARDTAGLSLDQMALAQLYSGYLNPTTSASIGRITVHNAADLRAAHAIFTPIGQPAAFMHDEF